MTYETILSCPNCGVEHKLVADAVAEERDQLRIALAAEDAENRALKGALAEIATLHGTGPLGTHEGDIARAALGHEKEGRDAG